ncbi:DUF4349 domain-containing protein [Streptomyces aureoverticillatus]|uniref:DUF4349 domain-containing protein n=1 Tax=Streptomyces aureoverticillatus TaxID=66871 RepID=UPI0013DA6317|nr:DUF4349 domain-containing protein [Streptomyces aureoverticillatus]QIB42970.1 DUF4349 domain-containing protein [Streptomyces aureoverticillatus]
MHASRTSEPGGTGARRGRTRRRAPFAVLAALLLAAALALAGCSAGGDDDAGGDSGKAAAAGPEAGRDSAELSDGDRRADRPEGGAKADSKARDNAKSRNPEGPSRTTDSHVIRTASLTVRVKDVPKALDQARTTAEGAGGLVGSESTDRDRRGHDRSRVVLRVPQDRYGQVLSDLAGTGRLISRNAKAEDVTEQVVDVESRIKTQRASVARVRALMDKATKISDIVSLEGELSSRQADLESLLAQQSSLRDRTAMATITLTLTESPQGERGDDGDDDPTLAGALSGGWDAFVTTLRWVAVALAAVLPFAAIAALLVLGWLRVVRPRMARGTEAVPAAGAAGAAPASGTAAVAPRAQKGPGDPKSPDGS